MRSSEDKAGRRRRGNEKKRMRHLERKNWLLIYIVCVLQESIDRRRFFFVNKHIECVKEKKIVL